MQPHKNKTLATLLALLFGSIGMHRFYLYGRRDLWGWVHLATLPLSALLMLGNPDAATIFSAGPFVVSVLASFLGTLLIGLTPDEKWDACHNLHSGRHSDTGWPVPLMLVLALACGATALIAAIARAFDILLTGGSYG
jgi:TM2 domain-containing membrane protein YozV